MLFLRYFFSFIGYAYFNFADICLSPEGKRHASEQRFTLLHVLQHLVKMNHPAELNILDKLSQIEQELLNFNHEDDISTRYQWSLYNHIFREDEDVKVPMMKLLYELQE